MAAKMTSDVCFIQQWRRSQKARGRNKTGRLAVDMDIHGYIHGYVHVWISDLSHPVDISMDIMLAHLQIKLTTYMLCLSIISQSVVRLNPTKIQVMWLGSPQQLAKVNVSEVPVASARINISETARNLSVIVDSQLTLSAQVAAVCRIGYYQLRQL